MPTIFPTEYTDLLDDATPATLILTTLRRDGMPVLAPVWFVAEGEGLLVVVDPASLKVKHIRNNPRVAAVILAPHEHNRYLHLHGEARERPDLDVQALYRRILARSAGWGRPCCLASRCGTRRWKRWTSLTSDRSHSSSPPAHHRRPERIASM